MSYSFLSDKLTEAEFRKLFKLKQNDGFSGKSWREWARYLTRNVKLYDEYGEIIHKRTGEALGELWMENFAQNIESHKMGSTKTPSIGDLPKHMGEPAIIIGAGPSIMEKGHLQMLAESKFNGVILVTDRMTIPCLKAGVTPDKFPKFYVGAVDGNREKIWKFFDDPIVDEYASKIIGLFASSVAPNAVGRFEKAGGKIYWFHAMLDVFEHPESLTRFMNYMTKHTAINSAGNVGAGLWTLAYYLGANPICLIGLNFGYSRNTSIEETAYYKTIMEQTGDIKKALSFFQEVYNPDFDVHCYTDLIFLGYKEAFLDNLKMAPQVKTINATEDGILFGSGIESMKFKDFLKQYEGGG